MFENLNDNIKSIFLMLLAISGGYVAQTLGCKTQKILTEKYVCKAYSSIFVNLFYIKCFE